MIDNLLHCYREKILVSIYCDLDDKQKHYSGYIIGIDDDMFFLAHISRNGRYDGYILRPIKDIYRIDYNGKYEKKLEMLNKMRTQSHNIAFAKNDPSTLLISVLEFAKNNNLVVSLILDDDCRAGLIKSYDNDIISLYALTDNGEEDGFAVVSIAEVSSFEIDTEYEQDLKILKTGDSCSS